MSEPTRTPDTAAPNYKRLRTTGIINAVLGTLSLFVSLSQLGASNIYIIPILISAFTIVASLRAVFSPIHRTFLAFALLFFVTGLWHLAVVFTRAAGTSGIALGVLGVFQILWAFQWVYQWSKRTGGVS